MAAFYNQASLSWGGRVTNSNIAEGEIITAVTLTKDVISRNYASGEGIVYAVSIINGGASDSNLTLTDNLGAYELGGNVYVPLEYIDGSMRVYINGVLDEGVTVTAGDALTVSLVLPAGANALVIYEAALTEFAPLDVGGVITNTATLIGGGIDGSLTDNASIAAREYALLTISKTVNPTEVTESGEITYTFVIQNTGNRPTVATDDLTVFDLFNPILSDISVELDGVALAEGVDYTYNEATGEFSTVPRAITVPAATYNQGADGIVTVTPGVAVLTVTGNI